MRELFWKPEKNDRKTDSACSLAGPARAMHTSAGGRYPLVPGRALSPNSIIVVLFVYTICFFFCIATETNGLTISTAMRSVWFCDTESSRSDFGYSVNYPYLFRPSLIDHHVYPSS